MMESTFVFEEEDPTENEGEMEEETEEISFDGDEVPPPHAQDLHGYEYTLAIIKPHAHHHVPSIERFIQEKGFTIIQRKSIILSAEQAAEFFMKREDHDTIKVPRLVCNMISGPTHVMILARRQAIREWLRLMGPVDPCEAKCLYPLSLRAKYGEDEQRNALYGSRNEEEAAMDIRYFFKDVILPSLLSHKSAVLDTTSSQSAISGSQSASDPCQSHLSDRLYLMNHVFPTLQKGLTELVRGKPLEPYQWLIDWLIENDPVALKLEPHELRNIPN